MHLSLEINLSMGRNTGRSKVVYSWISPNPAKAGPTLGGVVIVVVIHLYQTIEDAVILHFSRSNHRMHTQKNVLNILTHRKSNHIERLITKHMQKASFMSKYYASYKI